MPKHCRDLIGAACFIQKHEIRNAITIQIYHEERINRAHGGWINHGRPECTVTIADKNTQPLVTGHQVGHITRDQIQIAVPIDVDCQDF